MATTRVLEMSFIAADGDTSTIRVREPRTDLTEAQISGVMDVIIAQNVFAPGNVDLVAKKGARIVTRDTNQVYEA